FVVGRLHRTKPLQEIRVNAQVVAHLAPQLLDRDPALSQNSVERGAGARTNLGETPIDVRVGGIRRRVAVNLFEHETALAQRTKGRPPRGPRSPPASAGSGGA